MDYITKITILIGAVTGYLFGGFDTLVQVIIVLSILDYISGIIAAYVNSELKSKVGFKGIAKKVMLFLLIAAATWVDRALGTHAMFRDATIFFFIGNELLSLIENAGRSGVPVPDVLKNAVAVLKSKADLQQGDKEQ